MPRRRSADRAGGTHNQGIDEAPPQAALPTERRRLEPRTTRKPRPGEVDVDFRRRPPRSAGRRAPVVCAPQPPPETGRGRRAVPTPRSQWLTLPHSPLQQPRTVERASGLRPRAAADDARLQILETQTTGP